MRSTLSLACALAALAAPFAVAAQEKEGPRLDLEELTARAVEHPRARAEKYAIGAARGRAREAWGARFPQVEINAFGAPSPDIECDDPQCLTTSPEEATVALDGIFVGARIEVAQPLYTFGKLSAARSAARRAVESATFTREAVKGDLALRAARAYFGLKLARELLLMLEGGLEEIEKAQERLEEALAEGEGGVTVQDRLRLETVRAEVRSRIAEAREAQATALAAVRALAGDGEANIDEEPLASLDFELAEDAANYVVRGRKKRPELRAGRARVEAAHKLAELERARWFPDLLLLAGLDLAYAQGVDDAPSAFADDPFNKTSASLALVARWKLNPVSQGGQVKQANQNALRASTLYDAALSAAEVDIRRAHARAAQARARLEAAREGEKASRGWVASVLQAEAIGAAEPKELADAYIAYFQLRARVLESIHDWNVATVQLRRALGEYPPAVAGPNP